MSEKRSVYEPSPQVRGEGGGRYQEKSEYLTAFPKLWVGIQHGSGSRQRTSEPEQRTSEGLLGKSATACSGRCQLCVLLVEYKFNVTRNLFSE